MTLTASEVYRDFVTDGVPSSGAWKPLKKDIRNLLTAMSNGDADGIYDFIPASNVGAGTPNALKATTAVALPSAPNGALVAVNVYVDNTSSPVTVQFNDGTIYTVKTNSGNDVATGGLVAGSVIAGYISGTTFRMLSDQASAAIQAAAEAALAEFRRRSLGEYSSNPTTDPAGGALQQGAIYWNTVSKTWFYWDGDSWEAFPFATVADGAVTTQKLADGAVTDAKIASPSILRTRILNELWLNEPTFGLPPDTSVGGTTNASSAFQDMVDAANGRPMFLPPRQYPIMLNSTVELNRHPTGSGQDNEGPVIIGSGAYKSKILNRASGCAFKHTQSVAYAYATMPLFKYFSLIGDASTPAGSDGFQINGLGSPVFEQVKIDGMKGAGIRSPFDAAFANGDEMGNLFMIMRACDIRNCGGWGVLMEDGGTSLRSYDCYVNANKGGGYYIAGVASCAIEGGSASYNGVAGSTTCGGIWLVNNVLFPTSPSTLRVSQVEIDRNYFNAVRFVAAFNCRIDQCRIIDDCSTAQTWRAQRQIDLINCPLGENVISRNHFRLLRSSGTDTTIGVYTPSGTNNTFMERNYISETGGVTFNNNGGTNNVVRASGTAF